MNYVTSMQLQNARIRFYSYVIEPCKVTYPDGRTESIWDGHVKVTLENGEEKIWYFGGNADAGKLLGDMREAFDELQVVIV